MTGRYVAYRAFAPVLAVCGTLVGCAGSAPLPTTVGPEGGPASTELANDCFPGHNASPARTDPDPDPDVRALIEACGEADLNLQLIAKNLAEQQTETTSNVDVDAMSGALRAIGAPYVWPHAWLFNGSEGEVGNAKARMLRWLATFADGGSRRCGVAVLHKPDGRIHVGAIAVDTLADLASMPTKVRVGEWLDVRATLLVPASEAKFIVLGPHGAPHPVPTSFTDGHARARFNADQPGPWLIQLLAAVEGGPRPVLEALVYAGVKPPRTPSVPKAPGEDAAQAASDPRTALYAMVNAARDGELLAPFDRDAQLETLAQAHAEAMRRAHKTAHDAGDGDLNQRLEQAGLALGAGENVAHAGSAKLAQRALWASPSHRENLLFPGFNVVGIGVAADPDGTLWVCQIFGTSQ